MYQVARSWAPDCQVLKLDSMRVPDVPDLPGKAGAWEATFVSPARGTCSPYTWSAVDSVDTNLHKGVFQTAEQPYAAHGSGKPFLIAAVKTDSDAALATAKTKAVDYEKKNPRQPVTSCWRKRTVFPIPRGGWFGASLWAHRVSPCLWTPCRGATFPSCISGPPWAESTWRRAAGQDGAEAALLVIIKLMCPPALITDPIRKSCCAVCKPTSGGSGAAG